MLNSTSALKPKDIGQIRLMPIHIWCEDEEIKLKAEKFISIEFDDYLYLVSLDSLEGLVSLDSLEQINIHLIKIVGKHAELIFATRNKIAREFDDLEELLEDFGRELIAYYRRIMD